MGLHGYDDITCKLGFNYSRILSADGKDIKGLLKRLLAKKKEIDIRVVRGGTIGSRLNGNIDTKNISDFLCDGYFTKETPEEIKNDSFSEHYRIKNGKLYNVFSDSGVCIGCPYRIK